MIKPIYDHAGIQIYLGDCRDVLLGLDRSGIDLVLTDPPFGIDGGKGNMNRARGKGVYSGGLFTDDRAYQEAVIVPVMRDLIQTIKCVVLTPGWPNLQLYPVPASFGVFYAPAAVGMQTFGHADATPILYYGKNASGSNLHPCSYLLTEVPEKNGHPCPKPLLAWMKLLSNISKPGQCVLDPLLGSGTTLRAAKDLGMRGIGIEMNETFCEIAIRRLEQETIFSHEMAMTPPEQGGLL